MKWLLASPDHKQPRYWQYGINGHSSLPRWTIYSLPAPSQCWSMIDYENMCLCFLKYPEIRRMCIILACLYPWPCWHQGPLFSCDQAALWMVFSVCLSVCLSVCPSVCPSHLFDYVPIIVSSWNFQDLSPRTRVTSMQKVKVRGQRSRSQRSQPNLAVSGL